MASDQPRDARGRARTKGLRGTRWRRRNLGRSRTAAARWGRPTCSPARPARLELREVELEAESSSRSAMPLDEQRRSAAALERRRHLGEPSSILVARTCPPGRAAGDGPRNSIAARRRPCSSQAARPPDPSIRAWSVSGAGITPAAQPPTTTETDRAPVGSRECAEGRLGRRHLYDLKRPARAAVVAT